MAVSPQLAALDAQAIITIYAGRMQIEQTFRDVKNPRRGLGLSESQTRKPQLMAILLLIGALACYALWLIGLAVRAAIASNSAAGKSGESALGDFAGAMVGGRKQNPCLHDDS